MVDPYKKNEVISILDAGVQILHRAPIVDIDDRIKIGKIRIAAINTHVGTVFGICDRTEKRDDFSFEKVVREFRIKALHSFCQRVLCHRSGLDICRGDRPCGHSCHHEDGKENAR